MSNPDGKKALRREREAAERKPQKHAATLGDDIEAASLAASHQRTGKKRARQPEEEVATGLNNKLLTAARDQRAEVEAEERAAAGGGGFDAQPTWARRLLTAQGAPEDSDEDDPCDDDVSLGESLPDEAEEAREFLYEDVWDHEEEWLAPFQIAPTSGAPRSLGELIMERMRSAGANADVNNGDPDDPNESCIPDGLDARTVEMYRATGDLLARYKSGKVPKAFKVIPSLNNWEEVLYLTSPEQWTPHAMFQATRLFASNLNVKMAQRFFTLVLLPRVRADIRANKRLHFVLFCALRKACYKPAAFFKGLLLPLCAAGNCTLREAVVFGAIISRNSLPLLHAAAALQKLAEMEYSGTNSYFIRVLLKKKYALPYRVLDALVEHFMRFWDDKRQLPVVWHQALVTFVERYKFEITAKDKVRLRRLTGRQEHYMLTPDVLAELRYERSRGDPDPAAPVEPKLRKMPVLPRPLAHGDTGRTGEDPRALPRVTLKDTSEY